MRAIRLVASLTCAMSWLASAAAPRCLPDAEVTPAVARVGTNEASRIDAALAKEKLVRATLESVVLSSALARDVEVTLDAGSPGRVVFIGEAEPLFARRGAKLFRVRRPSATTVVKIAACGCPVVEPASGERGPPEAAAPAASVKGWVLPEGVTFAGVVEVAVAPTRAEVEWGSANPGGCLVPAARP